MPIDPDTFVLPLGRTLHIPGPGTTTRDLQDLAYRADRGRAFKPSGLLYLVKPDGETVLLRADGTTEIAEIEAFAQSLVEGT